MPGAWLPDPLEPLEIDGALLPRCVMYSSTVGHTRIYLLHAKEESIKLFHDYLDLHHQPSGPRCANGAGFGHVRPFRRGRERRINPPLRLLNGIQKFFAVSWLGRDGFVRFSPSRFAAPWRRWSTVPIRSSRPEAGSHRSHAFLPASGWPMIGPRLPARQDLFNKLLASKAIARAVEDEARSKISPEGTAEPLSPR
ncbi:hypothetical protein MJ561_02285 [Klebsiella pneumoniae]|nr:hypothetical protein MJ561_02285 [Klebsiella pneumoniae]